MANILHIVNGDSTSKILKQTTLKGDIMVFREMLCEGALDKKFGSDAFWKKRYTFFEETFNIPKLEYYDKTIKELVPLEDVYEYDEIVLWFEYDLFCQVNIMALCSYLLASFVKKINYYLVCTAKEKGKEGLQTLSDYSISEYPKLYENKTKITKNDLTFADTSWQVYATKNKEEIIKFNFGKNHKFACFYNAMQQELKRFPNKNGYNQIENKIIALQKEGITDKQKLVQQLLVWQKKETIYGFGDLQYQWHIERLQKQLQTAQT